MFYIYTNTIYTQAGGIAGSPHKTEVGSIYEADHARTNYYLYMLDSGNHGTFELYNEAGEIILIDRY